MSSARETDLNPNTYIGLSFPLRRDKFHDFALTKNSLQQAEHNLKNLLLTYPGERVGQPEFGSRLRALCFEQMDDTLPQRIEEEVRKSVSTWLPYINIIEVVTLTEEGDKNKIFVRMRYSTSLNPQTIQQIELDTSYTATIQ
jgi:phage baseplate assembly protein W|tara:strand:+ start:2276 stop:2701 length:426 start_codon:yes stop_codon:yes gene_type:complete